jgi:hypothetical protein
MMNSKQRTIIDLCIAAVVLAIFVAVISPYPSNLAFSTGVPPCLNHLKQLGLVLNMYANENHGWFPPIDDTTNNFIFDGNVLYPEYLSDVFIMGCKADPDIQWGHISRLRSNQHHPEFSAGWVHPDCITDMYYIYLGWLITSDVEAEAFFEAYDKMSPEDYDKDIIVPEGKGNGGGTIIHHLRRDMEPLLQELSLEPSQVPIMWDRTFTDTRNFNHQPAGGNVLYMHGHVRLYRYPGEFPISEKMSVLLEERRRDPIPDCEVATLDLPRKAATSSYFEAVGVMLLVALGVLLGWVFARLPKRLWVVGYVFPLFIVIAVAAARRVPALEFVPPISRLMAGRTEFVALALACTTLLTTVLMKLPGRRPRIILGIFMAIAASYLSVAPFIMPPFLRDNQLALWTNFDSYGVCLQSNHYNCGPAAAVTALKWLGISSEEGEMAVLAGTNPASGTQPDLLAAALQDAYGEHGLSCEYRLFDSVAELKEAGITIALIKLNLVTDHHVAILEVTDDEVIIGDPLEGKRSISHAEFEKIWRFSGIVLRKEEVE